MAAEMVVRASGVFGEGAASAAAAVARNATVAGTKEKVAAGVTKSLYLARGAWSALAIAGGAVGFVAGAAFVWHTRGWARAFVRYLTSPATPKAPRHESQRAQGQRMEWASTRRRSTMEHRRLARQY